MAITRENRKREVFWTSFIIICAAILGGVYFLVQWLR